MSPNQLHQRLAAPGRAQRQDPLPTHRQAQPSPGPLEAAGTEENPTTNTTNTTASHPTAQAAHDEHTAQLFDDNVTVWAALIAAREPDTNAGIRASNTPTRRTTAAARARQRLDHWLTTTNPNHTTAPTTPLAVTW